MKPAARISLISSKSIFSLVLLFILLLCGCGRDKNAEKVEKLKIVRGADQCALPGKSFFQPLIVEVQGPYEGGLLGSKGERSLVPQQKVLLAPLDGSALVLEKSEGESNSGGEVIIRVKAGKGIGDQYLKVIPLSAPEHSVTVRFVTGVQVLGNDQEAYAGKELKHPVSVKAVGPDGNPLKDVPVYFSMADDRTKAKIIHDMALTDADGIASTNVAVGDNTGIYTLEAEIADKSKNIYIRGIRINVMGLNLFQLIISVLGGLALFILGMTMMSDGLQIVAGENMKKFLQFFARNRFVAVLAGATVTAVIQSSSACSVMVIGFVNAGLLNLMQSIGIVLGADIGTTVTAQIISFNLGMLAMPAIIAGAGMIIIGKSKSMRGWGSTVLGFGLLFFGLEMMGDNLKTLGEFPSFIHFFSTFNCTPVNNYMPLGSVLGAFGVGVLMTVVIQSSSASIGIIMALAGSGLINFYTAMPLMLGANVGTAVTAVIASIPANKVGKQVALAHVMSKVFGASYMLLFFYVDWPGTDTPIFMYVVNELTRGDVFAVIPQNVMRHVANAHTLFNIINVGILISFVGVMAKICNKIIPVKQKDLKVTILEPHLLDSPSVAIEQVVRSLAEMIKEAWSMIDVAMLKNFMKGKADAKCEDELVHRKERINVQQQEISDYLMQLTRRELSESQTQVVPLLVRCAADVEKIAGHAENIIVLAARLKKYKKALPEKEHGELDGLWQLLDAQAKNVIAVLCAGSDETVAALLNEESINRLSDKSEKKHIERLRKRECDPVIGIIFIEMLGEIEKIGDRLANIAAHSPEIQRHCMKIG